MVGNKLYVVGGTTDLTGVGLSTVEALDPVAGWSTVPAMPTARWGAAAAGIADKLFVFGGSSWVDPIAEFNTVEVLNTTTGVWSTVAAMPTARRAAAAAPVDLQIHTFGGIQGFQTQGTATAVAERFDATAIIVPTDDPSVATAAGWLRANTPNPFRGSTDFWLQLDRGGDVQLVIFDLQGRAVQTVLNRYLPEGEHRATLPAGTLPPGVYFARLIVDRTAKGTLRIVAME